MAATGRNASWLPPRYPCHRTPSPRANGLREVSRDRPRSVVVGRSAKSHPRTAGRGTFHRGRLGAWKLPVGHPFTLPRRLSLRMTRRLESGLCKESLSESWRTSRSDQAPTQDGRAPLCSSPTPGLDDQACGSDSDSALRRTPRVNERPGVRVGETRSAPNGFY